MTEFLPFSLARRRWQQHQLRRRRLIPRVLMTRRKISSKRDLPTDASNLVLASRHGSALERGERQSRSSWAPPLSPYAGRRVLPAPTVGVTC